MYKQEYNVKTKYEIGEKSRENSLVHYSYSIDCNFLKFETIDKAERKGSNKKFKL